MEYDDQFLPIAPIAINFDDEAKFFDPEAEADFLRGLGVDLVQGFLYARPMPARAFEAWLAEKRKLRLIA